LYAEVLRRPGLADSIQRDYRVIVSGPTSFSAVLNSLQMGFRTLAIEKRTSEVWNLLGTVKTEFGKFGDVIEATQKKLDAASKQFESVGQRTRAINRKLKEVEALPLTDSSALQILDDDETPA
jgi:DNA recombination protein RmuC